MRTSQRSALLPSLHDRQKPIPGKAFDDIGQTFFDVKSPKSSRSNKRRSPSLDIQDDSKDELDLLSQLNDTPSIKIRKVKVDIRPKSKEGAVIEEQKTSSRSAHEIELASDWSAKKYKTNKSLNSDASCALSSRKRSTPNESEHTVSVREPRPNPKPAYKQPSEIKTRQSLRAFPEITPLSSTSTRGIKSRKNSSFPVSPISSPREEAKEKKDDTKKKTKGTKGKTKSTFPMSMPPSTRMPPTRKSSTFPLANISPPKFSGRNETKHQPTLSLSSSSSDGESASKPGNTRGARTHGGRGVTRKKGLKPFPLGSQMLKTIDKSESSTRFNKTQRERQSFDNGSGSEDANDLDYGLDEDSFTLPPDVDPSTLCPYCDHPLPSNPTPYLVSLLERAASHPRTRRDPRPSNPLGRKAPLLVFVTVCQRHRFENVWLPQARRKGWKEKIDWAELSGRIEAFRDALEAILNDLDVDFPDEEDVERGKGKMKARDSQKRWGPRKRCVFWKELMLEVKKSGMRSLAGVRGQYDNFEKIQPGYYGEVGSAIIHRTLYNLFPPTSISALKTHPLTPADFIQRILVPQVGLLLIQEDLDCSVEEALRTMRESAQYGVSMFPYGEDGEEDTDEDEGVAELMVVEQARRRRKELEKEEREQRRVAEKDATQENRAETRGQYLSDERLPQLSRRPSRSISKWSADAYDGQEELSVAISATKITTANRTRPESSIRASSRGSPIHPMYR